MDTLDAKVREALALAGKALAEEGDRLALFDASPAGVALLHMLRKAEDGGVGIPVLLVRSPGQGPGTLKFADKLRRIWLLDMSEAVLPDKGGEPADDMAAAASESGAGTAILPLTGGPEVSEERGMKVYRPLSGFTAGDVDEYVERYGLPRPSPGSDEAGDKGEEGFGEDEDAVAEKLRELGYM